MTRPKNPETARKEARLQEALAAVCNKEHNVPAAAKKFGVSRRTLYYRVNGVPPRSLAHESEQILTHAEEKELARWITRLTVTGYPPRHSTLREMAEEVRKRRVK
jgi:transposase-like protein